MLESAASCIAMIKSLTYKRALNEAPPLRSKNLLSLQDPFAMSLSNALDDSPPPRKRARQICDDKSDPRASNPRLFVPFRALGLVTNHVPCVLQTRSFKGATEGPRVHILTCLNKSWALWEGGKMTLLFVGE